jgi:hypothetical protein
MKGQTWGSCKYSAKGTVGCCSEYFSCLNEKIAEIGAYPKLRLEKNCSAVVSSTLFNHSHLNPGGAIDLEWPRTVFLQSEIDRALRGCQHCKFHETREGEQTRFGEIVRERGADGIFYTYRNLKIVDTSPKGEQV